MDVYFHIFYTGDPEPSFNLQETITFVKKSIVTPKSPNRYQGNDGYPFTES